MAEKDQDRKVAPLNPHGLQLAEARRVMYFVAAAEGVQPDDVVRPDYWAHEAAKLKPRDRIEIHAYDGTWFMEVLVLDVSRAFARVKPIVGPVSLTTSDVAQTQAHLDNLQLNYEVMLRGPRKWSIVHKQSRDIVKEDIETKDGALQWMKDNAAKLTA